MAKVVVDTESVDIRVSLLERVMLSEKPRRVPLSRIRRVDPHPRLIDMMMHWSDQSGAWLCGVSTYDGHLIPSARNPQHTLAIDVEGEEQSRIYIEVDDEPTDHVAQRIEAALRAQAQSGEHAIEPDDAELGTARRSSAAEIAQLLGADAYDDDDDLDDADADDDVRIRDPLMQGSLPPPPMAYRGMEEAREGADGDRVLVRLGSWLIAVGVLGLVSGTSMVAAGVDPGMLAVGAGVACGVLGSVALSVVSRPEQE